MLMASEALKARSFEKIGASESDEMEIIEMGSLIKVGEVGNTGRGVSGHAPSIEDDYCTQGCDGAVVEFIDGMEVCPATPSSETDSMDLSCSATPSSERDSMDLSIVLTPLKSIFDPFAPAPEELVVAPMKRTLKSMQIPHLRKMRFYDCGDYTQMECHASEEDQLSELLSRSFFELVVSRQLQEISARKLSDQDQQEHSKYANTPLSLCLLSGIAETCPPAPKREPAESTKLDPGVCRQLDFLDNMAG